MNETTHEQGLRLVKAGYSDVTLVVDEFHHIMAKPIPLGKLWDAVRKLDRMAHIPTTISSKDLVETLVRILEENQGRP